MLFIIFFLPGAHDCGIDVAVAYVVQLPLRLLLFLDCCTCQLCCAVYKLCSSPWFKSLIAAAEEVQCASA
jgi:hypothetical protein